MWFNIFFLTRLALNPGQIGCDFDVQCSGAWPGATCDASKTCQCGAGNPPTGYIYKNYFTQDGTVCVLIANKSPPVADDMAIAVCPTPVGFFPVKGKAVLGTVQTALDPALSTTAGTTRTNCIYGGIDATATNGVTCIAPDLYDCIPVGNAAVPANTGNAAATAGTPVASSGICCPTRGTVCDQ